MPTMTKAHHQQYAKILRRCDAVSTAVYMSAHPRIDIPFKDCLARASGDVKAEFEACCVATRCFEGRMIAEGRAYFATFGVFKPYPTR